MAFTLANIESTLSTSYAKKYLVHFGSKLTPEVIAGALEKVREDNEDSDLIHLQIFLFIDDTSVKYLLEKFADELFPLNPKCNGITTDFYLHLISRLNFHQKFLQMILASSNEDQSLSEKLISSMVPSAIQEYQECKISLGIVQLYLKTLAKLSLSKSSYFELFRTLMETFMEELKTNQSDKIITVLGILGVVLMADRNVADDDEIIDLIGEYDLDHLTKFENGKTFSLFRELYQNAGKSDKKYSREEFCQILQLVFQICERQEMQLWTESKNDWEKEVLDVIGNSAHFVCVAMLKQKEQDLVLEKWNALYEFAKLWSQFKPKISFEDFEEGITSFDDFCELMMKHGGKNPKYRDNWFSRFMNYSGCCESLKGLKIAETLIAPNANFDIGVKLIGILRTAMKNNTELQELMISIILTIALNPIISSRRDGFVAVIYKDGVHLEFAENGFEGELNSLLIKLGGLEDNYAPKYVGAAEVLTLEKEREEYQNSLFRVWFQNPTQCALKMLLLALKTQKFRSLQSASGFLSLKVLGDAKEACKFSESPTVLDFSLFIILCKAQEKDSLFDKIGKNLPYLVAMKIISFENLYAIMEYSILALLECEEYDKWLKLMRVYVTFFTFVLATKSPKQDAARFVTFARKILLGQTFIIKTYIHQVIIDGRGKCYEILSLARKQNLVDENEYKYSKEELESFQIIDLGYGFMRNANAQKCILEFVTSNASVAEKIKDDTLINNVLNWVTLSCSFEWKAMINFVETLLSLKPSCTENTHTIVNECILAAAKQGEIRLNHYLSFLSYYLHIQENEKPCYQEMLQEHFNVVNTLVTILTRLYDPTKKRGKKAKASSDEQNRNAYRSGLVQQSLLILLQFVEWMVLKSTQFEKIQDDCLTLVSSIQRCVTEVGCSTSVPIFMTILSKLKNGTNDMSTIERCLANVEILPSFGNGLQVRIAENADVSSEILENYRHFYQKVPDDTDESPNLEDTEAVENKDVYPFQKLNNNNSTFEVGLLYG